MAKQNQAFIYDDSKEMEDIVKNMLLSRGYKEQVERDRGSIVFLREDSSIKTMNCRGVYRIMFYGVSDEESNGMLRICPRCGHTEWKVCVPYSFKGEVVDKMYKDGLLEHWPGAFDRFGFPSTRKCMSCHLECSYANDFFKWQNDEFKPVDGKIELALY